MDNITLVRQALIEVLEKKSDIAHFFSTDYTQIVNGEELNYAQFSAHISHLRALLSFVEVEIISLAENGDSVHSHYYVKTGRLTGSYSQFEVFARFVVVGGKIKNCFELTRQVSGCSKDEDLGQRV